MYRYYRAHLASQRGPLFNALVYVGIALKFVASAAASVSVRALQRFDTAGTAP
jgi:hypothetical protein